ncbi:hypothetical protein TERTU_1440 [Teredinibacter turnerae T7901]|uniref:Uncharacterized protein n=2 Tax=Teredinibacter turnerae TaxID=2426 RepID=C5BSP0_TERTT|nr:hypothetical protein TERTU_1440 [Teredinibacter turnerae T7901]
MSQRDIVKYLEPGLAVNVPLNSDEFVYVKDAPREIDVTINQQVLKMERGDKSRFSAPVDELVLLNPHDVRIRVVLTVGRGDYEKLVVSGELSLAENIRTNALGSINMPVEFTKTFGLVSDVQVVHAANTVISTTPIIDVTGSNFARAFFEWDNKIYLIDNTHIYIYDYAANLVGTKALSNSLQYICGGDVDPVSGNAYVVERNGIVRINLYSGDVFSVYNEAGFYFGCGLGAHIVGGELVFIRAKTTAGDSYKANEVLYRYPLGADEVNALPLTGFGGNYTQNLSIDRERGELLQSGSGSHVYQAFDMRSQRYLGERRFAVTHSGGYLSRKKNNFITSKNNSIEVCTVDAIEYAARLYIQDGEDETTRREFSIAGDYGFLSRNSGVVLRGNIVAAILQGLDIGGGLASNYLDYVVSLKYTDGNYTLLRDAGSSSFAYRGYEDIGELLLESEVTIRLLPQYLTAQI